MSDIERIILTGRCKWAKVQEPVPALDEDKPYEYTIDLEVDAESLKLLYSKGMSKKRTPKEDGDGVKYLKFVRPTHSAAGKELKPLVVIDRNKRPFTDLVGNGSVVNVAIDLIPYSNKFGTGVVVRPAAVQVVDLVPYTKGGDTVLDAFEALDDDDMPAFDDVDTADF